MINFNELNSVINQIIMIVILSSFIGVVLLLLSLIHFNWVFGGQFGFSESLPTNEKGERVLHPKKIDSAMVALVLMTFSGLYILKSELMNVRLPEWILNYSFWIVPFIFLLRAMGDFKYIGFFKRIKKTDFAKRDTSFFSPLCLTIGVIGIIINLIY